MYTFLLYIHIISAIGSIGPLFVLLVLLSRMRKVDTREWRGHVHPLQGGIDVVRHAGHAVVISGILLILFGSWSFAHSWVVLTLILLVASLVFLARAFKPTMQTFGSEAFNKQQFIFTLQRNTWIYITLLLMIMALMVFKPIIW